MKSELLPCPFCGGKPTVWQIEEVGGWRAGCAHESCPMFRVTTLHRPTKAEAIAAWNRRYVCLDKNRWIPVGEGLPGKKELDIKIQVANSKTKRVLQWTWFNSIAQISGLKTCYTHWRPIILPEGE